MILVDKPKVFLIAETKLRNRDIVTWLTHLDGVEALDHATGSDSEKMIELAGKRCYKSFKSGLNPNVTKVTEDSAAYHDNILASGHGSVLEHCSATFAFEDVSRVFTHEMVRNRAGLAYSQESLRYVRLEDLRFWIPPEIKNNEEAEQLFYRMIRECEGAQQALAKTFNIDDLTTFGDKKRLTSLFRRIAPIGLATGIVVTFNMRALRWCIEQRTSEAAEIEMRIVFNEVALIAKREWPMLFSDFNPYTIEGSDIPEWQPTNRKV